MWGVVDYNYPKFHEVAEKWRGRGYEVFNPAEITCKGDIRDWKWFMRRNIRRLVMQDAVVMIEDWQLSSGSLLEYEVAKAFGLGRNFEPLKHCDDGVPATKWDRPIEEIIARVRNSGLGKMLA